MKTMSRWGVGPVFALYSFLYVSCAITISLSYPHVFVIQILPAKVMIPIASVLLISGLIFYIAAVKAVMKAYAENRLYIKGAFACCRHPVYASWVVFIVPSVALFMKSWIVLSGSILMYVLLKRLTKREDAYLENRFKEPYIAYKKNVPAVLPIGMLIKKNKGYHEY